MPDSIGLAHLMEGFGTGIDEWFEDLDQPHQHQSSLRHRDSRLRTVTTSSEPAKDTGVSLGTQSNTDCKGGDISSTKRDIGDAECTIVSHRKQAGSASHHSTLDDNLLMESASSICQGDSLQPWLRSGYKQGADQVLGTSSSQGIMQHLVIGHEEHSGSTITDNAASGGHSAPENNNRTVSSTAHIEDAMLSRTELHKDSQLQMAHGALKISSGMRDNAVKDNFEAATVHAGSAAVFLGHSMGWPACNAALPHVSSRELNAHRQSHATTDPCTAGMVLPVGKVQEQQSSEVSKPTDGSQSAPAVGSFLATPVAFGSAAQHSPDGGLDAAETVWHQAAAAGADDQSLLQLALSLGLIIPDGAGNVLLTQDILAQQQQDEQFQAAFHRDATMDGSALAGNALLSSAADQGMFSGAGGSMFPFQSASTKAESAPLPKLDANMLLGLSLFSVAGESGSDSMGVAGQFGESYGLACGGTGATLGSTLLSCQGPARQHTLYKTELCRGWLESGTCRYGSKCQFAHGPSELRPVPRHPKYKTEVCRSFTATGVCAYGPRCRFIHDTTSAPCNAMFDPGMCMGSGMGRLTSHSVASLTGCEGLDGALDLGETTPRTSAMGPFGARTSPGTVPTAGANTSSALRHTPTRPTALGSNSVPPTGANAAWNPKPGPGITAQDAAAITRLGKLINASPGLSRASLDSVMSSSMARRMLAGLAGSAAQHQHQHHSQEPSRRSSMGDVPRRAAGNAYGTAAWDAAATPANLAGGRAALSSSSMPRCGDMSWGQAAAVAAAGGTSAGPDWLSALAAAGGNATEPSAASPSRGNAGLPGQQQQQVFTHVPFASGMPGIPEGVPVRGASMQMDAGQGFVSQGLWNSLAYWNLTEHRTSQST